MLFPQIGTNKNIYTQYDKYHKINIFINILRYKSFFLVFHLHNIEKTWFTGEEKKKTRQKVYAIAFRW